MLVRSRVVHCSSKVWAVWWYVKRSRVLYFDWLVFCFSPSASSTDNGCPWDPLSTVNHALQEVTIDTHHPSQLFSSHPVPDHPYQFSLEVRVCMAGQAPQLTDQGSIQDHTGGRPTQQKYTIWGQGARPGLGEVDEGTGKCLPATLPPKSVLGRTTNRREMQRDPSSPSNERKDLQTQGSGSACTWDSVGVSVNGGAHPGNTLNRLESTGLLPRVGKRPIGNNRQCYPSNSVEDSTEHSSTASPGHWKLPGLDKLPGTLRSWTSTVSR